MFTPNNEKLKTIVFHLLKKPIYTIFNDSCSMYVPVWTFDNKNPWKKYCTMHYPTKRNNTWYIKIEISQNTAISAVVKLTEKEAMEIKWQLEDIVDTFEEKLLNDLADFALEENGTQDELLDD